MCLTIRSRDALVISERTLNRLISLFIVFHRGTRKLEMIEATCGAESRLRLLRGLPHRCTDSDAFCSWQTSCKDQPRRASLSSIQAAFCDPNS